MSWYTHHPNHITGWSNKPCRILHYLAMLVYTLLISTGSGGQLNKSTAYGKKPHDFLGQLEVGSRKAIFFYINNLKCLPYNRKTQYNIPTEIFMNRLYTSYIQDNVKKIFNIKLANLSVELYSVTIFMKPLWVINTRTPLMVVMVTTIS